jgi:hypothetical protein
MTPSRMVFWIGYSWLTQFVIDKAAAAWTRFRKKMKVMSN